jgi:ligand-binding SRPBCC domain-containing protein
MPLLALDCEVRAPAALCFDLARDLDLHIASTEGTGERLIARTASGLAQDGEEITWEARHLGVRQRLTVRICSLERPRRFVDEQVRGAFAWFRHEHLFEPLAPCLTRMVDRFEWRSPLGPLGALADWLFVEQHLRGFLQRRMRFLAAEAERRSANSLTPQT